MNEFEKIDYLFNKGVELFNKKKFYDAHEEWEEMWSDYYLKDRLFIQGLIQLTVSFYHLSTNNINGSKNLMERAIQKLTRLGPNNGSWSSNIRGIYASEFISKINICSESLMKIQNCDEFNWNLVPMIKKIKK